MLSPVSHFSRSLKLLSAAAAIPHPAKAHFGGEDAWLIAPNDRVVGVADGVGGWANVANSNSARVSRELMEHASMFSDMSGPDTILQEAFEKLDKKIIGTTTATIVQLSDKTLKVLNLGDSGCSVYRNGKRIFKSTELTHGFNYPFQLGYTSNDRPTDGKVESVEVKEGDIVITATDGVWDNVYDADIAKETEIMKSVKETAERIVKAANRNGADQTFHSPFAQEAKEHGFRYEGGKLDDATVVVSKVVP